MVDNENTPIPEENVAEELSHSDKLTGIFTEPSAVFTLIRNFPLRTIDWLLPLFILLLLVSVSSYIMMSNPEIRGQVIEKQRERVEKNLEEQVAKGNLTRSQAEEQMSKIEDELEKIGSPGRMALQTASIFIFGSLVFFVVCGFYFLVARFFLKGELDYKAVLIASGLSGYINSLSTILVTLVAMVTNKLIQGLALGSFIESPEGSLTAFLLSKLDPFTIWSLVVFGLGLAKLGKSEDSRKFIITVLAIWFGWGLLWHFIVQAVPFLKFFGA